jgi:hypothetical protein
MWNALSKNCNHYAAGLARAAGLKAPDDLQLSYGFVPTMRELNEQSSQRGSGAPARHAGATARKL